MNNVNYKDDNSRIFMTEIVLSITEKGMTKHLTLITKTYFLLSLCVITLKRIECLIDT